MKLLLVIVLLAFTSPVPAGEQPEGWLEMNMDPEAIDQVMDVITVQGPLIGSFESTPYRSEGVLQGCGYSFQVMLKDWAYRKNQPVSAYGSIVFWAPPEKANHLTLRIGLTDVEQRDGKLWQRQSAVNYAYIRFQQHSTAGKESSSMDGEDGVKIFLYPDPTAEMMSWLLLGEPITVGFNRKPKASDIEFEIPVMSFTEAWMATAVCFRELSGMSN